MLPPGLTTRLGSLAPAASPLSRFWLLPEWFPALSPLAPPSLLGTGLSHLFPFLLPHSYSSVPQVVVSLAFLTRMKRKEATLCKSCRSMSQVPDVQGRGRKKEPQ